MPVIEEDDESNQNGIGGEEDEYIEGSQFTPTPDSSKSTGKRKEMSDFSSDDSTDSLDGEAAPMRRRKTYDAQYPKNANGEGGVGFPMHTRRDTTDFKNIARKLVAGIWKMNENIGEVGNHLKSIDNKLSGM